MKSMKWGLGALVLAIGMAFSAAAQEKTDQVDDYLDYILSDVLEVHEEQGLLSQSLGERWRLDRGSYNIRWWYNKRENTTRLFARIKGKFRRVYFTVVDGDGNERRMWVYLYIVLEDEDSKRCDYGNNQEGLKSWYKNKTTGECYSLEIQGDFRFVNDAPEKN